MLLSDFLKLVPGPEALVGGVAEFLEPGFNRVERVLEGQRGRYLAEMGWKLVEKPPLYQNPATRYCAWCQEPLYKGYSPKTGLTEGWCPNHGEKAPVLHADTTNVGWDIPLVHKTPSGFTITNIIYTTTHSNPLEASGLPLHGIGHGLVGRGAPSNPLEALGCSLHEYRKLTGIAEGSMVPATK